MLAYVPQPQIESIKQKQTWQKLNYTVSQKKVPTFELSATLSNLKRFSKFLNCCKAHEICYKTHDITHLTLGMLLHYLEKLKIQISADIQQIWKKMQTDCIFNSL